MVKQVDDLHYHDNEKTKHSLNGQIIYGKAFIEIEKDVDPQLVAPILVHEAVHGILHNAGHDDEDEEQVIALGYGIVSLIRDNPELVKLIQGEA